MPGDNNSAETAVVTSGPDDRVLRRVDVLWGISADGERLPIPIEQRAEALTDFLRMVAEREMAYEEATNPHCPWIPKDGDKPTQLREKELLQLAEVERRVYAQLGEWEEMIAHSMLRQAIRIDQTNAAWMQADGTVKTLRQELGDLVPQERRSGRDYQMAAFVEQTSRILMDHGIPPDEIAACRRPGMESMLSYVSQYASKVLDRELYIQGEHVEMDDERREQELRQIVTMTQAVERTRDLEDWLRDRYRDPAKPPPPKIDVATERSEHGERVRAVMEMTSELWAMLADRMGHHLADRPGYVVPVIGPYQLQQALGTPLEGETWSDPQQRLMHATVMANWARAICLEVLCKNVHPRKGPQWITVDDVCVLPTVDLSRREAQVALHNLVNILEDGVHPYAETKETPDHVRYWRRFVEED